jgi:uncharacterized protein (TIGR03435 family)
MLAATEHGSLLIVIACFGYSQTTDKPLAFDAASIKPNATVSAEGRAGPAGGSVRITQGTVVGRNVTARRIILTAYRLSEYQLSGGPAWLDRDTFDLNAKANTPANAEQVRQMLQTFLAERFKLTIRHGTKEMQVYALTVGKNGLGPNLHELKEGQAPPNMRDENWGNRSGRAGPTVLMRGHLSDFALALSADPFNRLLGRPVVDKTGDRSIYTGLLHWLEIEGHPGTPDDDDVVPALRDEFGFRLESQKAPIDILLIDPIEKPDAN